MRNVWILATAQACAACGTIILVTFGGIVGMGIAPRPELATAPLSLAIVGLALATIPAAWIMQRIGRKRAFIASACLGILAAVGSAAAISRGNFGGFAFAGFFLGVDMAFVQQYRFADTEYVDAASAGRAVSTVMLGTLAVA
jgi:MFS family permease